MSTPAILARRYDFRDGLGIDVGIVKHQERCDAIEHARDPSVGVGSGLSKSRRGGQRRRGQYAEGVCELHCHLDAGFAGMGMRRGYRSHVENV
ncbi:MAG: hypothetical protein H0W33_14200 [Gammaproteobacteria bacterium]|nr:hypothetical protein [Gammaproteobacteria bacterium]